MVDAAVVMCGVHGMIGSATSLWGFGLVLKLRKNERFEKGENYVREYNTQFEGENGVVNEL